MKKLLFITLFFSLNISYASFPVEENYVERKEFNLNESKINTTILNEDNNVFAIISTITALISVLYLFFGGPEGLILSLIFSIIAMLLGIIGFKKKNRNFAFFGFGLGLVSALLSSIILIFIQLAVATVT